MSSSYVELGARHDRSDPNAAKHAELTERGYSKIGKEPLIYRGRKCTKTCYEKKPGGTLGRVVRGAGGVIGSIATAGLINISKEFRDATWTPAVKGAVKETLYAETGEEEDIRPDLGYNPKNSESIQDYLKDPDIRSQLRESNGHYFLPERRRKGISSFIFVPHGDFRKARSIKFWTAGTGKSVTNTEKQLRSIRSYCATYEDVESKWEKELPKLAASLIKKHPGMTEQQAIARIKRRPKTVVVDARNGVARVYGKFDPNKVNPDSYFTGTLIKLEKDTDKEIKRIHGKSMEHKEPLGGERPFKQAIPDPVDPPHMESRSRANSSATRPIIEEVS